ncbi:CheR Chemotaxis protein methyltransferase, MCP methyltransferase, Protein-glutamate O-methyltransferase_ [Planktothrix sp. PCC 11201]|uniref:CheR family methyltransferase n=1 Tax=Planktothrix sp. PCC 11201 TaxID=1729650 RepID=UPI00091241B6|nr:protein-glutamate O-methyltransferase CheR [Planktothrix sp. PCC 11201]SKB15534.1 CheR Chemotaxis protein methyltransferase, MCP methyltransferase, Protein-glutamate O-methyltransferase_ [Planktothrix sp. PCC 11201]
MKFSSEPLDLSDNTFVILRDLIHERTGLFYGVSKQTMLADKLSIRVKELGLESFLDYYYLLKYDQSASVEWQEVINALTVQETYFWREYDQIKVLVEVLLPKYLERFYNLSYPGQPLRIWSAACSTGEEPLTIAIALHEAGWFERIPIEIWASDASSRAIHKAVSGVYRPYSFRGFPESLKAKYFSAHQEEWQISPLIHNRVHWSVNNLLVESDIQYLAQAHFIFCRNVFIYFSEASISKTVNFFYQRMFNPGYLFLSASESLLKLKTNFELQEIDGSFVYAKQKK